MDFCTVKYLSSCKIQGKEWHLQIWICTDRIEKCKWILLLFANKLIETLRVVIYSCSDKKYVHVKYFEEISMNNPDRLMKFWASDTKIWSNLFYTASTNVLFYVKMGVSYQT